MLHCHVTLPSVVSGMTQKQASKASLSTEQEPLPADKAYQVLSHDVIRLQSGNGFPAATEVFQATGTACKFARLPSKVLDSMDKLCRPQLAAMRPRACQMTSARDYGGVASLSAAEVELVLSGQAPECVAAEVMSMHHTVRYKHATYCCSMLSAQMKQAYIVGVH